MQSTERWLAIPGWDGLYEVSDAGRVRTAGRTVQTRIGPRHFRARMMKPWPTAKGHRMLSLHRDGKRKYEYVHRLVLLAFVGPPPEGTEGCHYDGDPSNNHLSNLRWDTHTANMADRIRHGRVNSAQSKKAACPQGHLLTGDNLVPAGVRAGKRNCRACANERSYAHYKRIPFSAERAAERYREYAG